MNDFRMIAKFVQDNNLTVQRFTVKGTAGGFDDYSGYRFFKGDSEIEGVTLITSIYDIDEKKEIEGVLSALKQGLGNLKHADVTDMKSLESFLKNKVVG